MNKYTYLQEFVPRLMAGGSIEPLEIPLDWYLAAPEAAQRTRELVILCNDGPIEYTALPGTRVSHLQIIRASSVTVIGNVGFLTLRSCKDLTSDTFHRAQIFDLTLIKCLFRNNALTIAAPSHFTWTYPAGDLTMLGRMYTLQIERSPVPWSYTADNQEIGYLSVSDSVNSVIPVTGVRPFRLNITNLQVRQSIASLLWDGIVSITSVDPRRIPIRDLLAIVKLPNIPSLHLHGAMPEKAFIDMATTLLFRLRKRPAGSSRYTLGVRALQLTRSKVPSVPKYITLTAVVRKIVADLNAVPNVYSEMPILAN